VSKVETDTAITLTVNQHSCVKFALYYVLSTFNTSIISKTIRWIPLNPNLHHAAFSFLSASLLGRVERVYK
jgi:hypothetical protein